MITTINEFKKTLIIESNDDYDGMKNIQTVQSILLAGYPDKKHIQVSVLSEAANLRLFYIATYSGMPETYKDLISDKVECIVYMNTNGDTYYHDLPSNTIAKENNGTTLIKDVDFDAQETFFDKWSELQETPKSLTSDMLKEMFIDVVELWNTSYNEAKIESGKQIPEIG